MTIYGYARVSTDAQETALQLDALRRAGVRKVIEETRSGVAVRPALDALLLRLRPGDGIVVYKVDRLARSLVDLLRIVGVIESSGASVRSLTEPFETGTPLGRLMVQLLGSFSEFERSVIRERCVAGRAAAVARGVRMGRPRVLPEGDELLRELERAGTQVALAKLRGCCQSSVCRAVAAARGYPRKQPRVT